MECSNYKKLKKFEREMVNKEIAYRVKEVKFQIEKRPLKHLENFSGESAKHKENGMFKLLKD